MTDWTLRVVGGREFHSLVADGKNELKVVVRRVKFGRSGNW